MKIINAEIFRFSLPLLLPLKIKTTTLYERTGLLLKLTDDKSTIGFGEISPLPGLHSESLIQAEKNLVSLLDALKGEYPNEPGEHFILLPDDLINQNILSSVRFGVEMVIWNLMPGNNQQHKKIKVNGLLTGSTEEMLINAAKLLSEGYDVLKLKVGRRDIDSEIGFILQLRKTFGYNFQLRLDANRSWDFDSAVYFGKNVVNEQIEYIEEPLKDFKRLDELYFQTSLPFAIDESLFEFDDLPIKTKALILKPSFVGGIHKTYQFIKLAQSKGIQPIISSAFESGLGLRTLAKVASFIPENIAMGLDTFRRFKNDVIKPPFIVKNGFVEILPFKENYKLNYSMLEKIH